MFKSSALALTLSCAAVLNAEADNASAVSDSIKPSKVVIKDFATKSGLKVWFVATPEIPVFTIALSFKEAGSGADPKKQSGISAFLASMLTEGAGDKKASEFKRYLLENNINLSVGQNDSDFSISLRTTKDKTKIALEVVKLILTNPRFDKEKFDLVRSQILITLSQSLHSEQAVVHDLADQTIFKGHAYGDTIAQSMKDLQQIKVKDLRDFMKTHFTRDRLQISVAGAIEQEELSSLLDSTFGDLPAKASEPAISDILPTLDGKIHVKYMDIPQSVILFYHPGISRQDPDFYAAYILNKIIGDGNFESRLWNEVREKRGLAYGIDSDLVWNQHTYYLYGTTATQNKNVQEVIDIIRKEWKKVLEDGIKESELNFVKQRLIGSYPLGFASTRQIAGLMSSYQNDHLDADFINKRNSLIAAVSIDDVNRVAKKLLNPDALTFFVVGNPDGLPETTGTK